MKIRKELAILGVIGLVAFLASLHLFTIDVWADDSGTLFIPIVRSQGGKGSVPTATPTSKPTSTPEPTETYCKTNDSILNNGGFEDGQEGWSFYSDGEGDFHIADNAQHCQRAAEIFLETVGKNVQLYQRGFQLNNATRYRLTFSAYSESGADLSVHIHKHTAPYTDLGLSRAINVRNEWQIHELEFDTTGIAGATTDTRIRFAFAEHADDGESYWIDNVHLQEIGADPDATPESTNTPRPTATEPSGPTATPTEKTTKTPEPTASPTPKPTKTPQPTATAEGGAELLVFNLNRVVTEADRGFPNDTPPINNFDWTRPTNYTKGTLYFYVKIRSQPVPQDMRLQICFWQEVGDDRFANETCGRQYDVRGTAGNVVTWSQPFDDMWNKPNHAVEWDRPRYRAGIAIKNEDGLPVSDFSGWNWNGEDPKKWYPLDMQFRVVVVAPGQNFPGWENIEGSD